MKHKKIPLKEIFLFGFATIALNMCATFAVGLFAKYAIKPLGISVFSAILMWISLIIICIGIPLLILYYYYFRKRVAYQYQPSENKQQWLKSALKLILPSELLRFILCLSKLGLLDSFGMFAFPPSFLYEQTYLIWFDRTNDVRHFGNAIFGDYIGFIVCYMLYAIIYVGALFGLYHFFWKKECAAHNEMLRHETNKRFY